MRKLIKKILKENELQWINDVKSHQDIAQEIADETKIKNGLLHTPFSSRRPPLPLSPLFLLLLPSHPPSFTKYGKEQYGLDNEDDINDIWERYKKLVRDKVNNINESDDMQWIKDIKPYVPFEDADLGTTYNVIINIDDEFLQALWDCGEDIDINEISYVKVANRDRVPSHDIYCDQEGKIYWEGYEDCLQINFYNKHDEVILSHWFASDHLIQLQYI